MSWTSWHPTKDLSILNRTSGEGKYMHAGDVDSEYLSIEYMRSVSTSFSAIISFEESNF